MNIEDFANALDNIEANSKKAKPFAAADVKTTNNTEFSEPNILEEILHQPAKTNTITIEPIQATTTVTQETLNSPMMDFSSISNSDSNAYSLASEPVATKAEEEEDAELSPTAVQEDLNDSGNSAYLQEATTTRAPIATSEDTNEPMLSDQIIQESTATFTAKHYTNPLVAVASPLFIMISYLLQSNSVSNLQQLHHNLTGALYNFEQNAQTSGYQSYVILSAHYALCALIDQILDDKYYDDNMAQKPQSLLQALQQEPYTSDHFFILLERCCQNPKDNIDLLELVYMCLSLGFQGMYQQQENGHQQLAHISDKLYQVIREQRGEFSKKLLTQTFHNQQEEKIRTLTKPIIPLVITAFTTIISMMLIYAGLSYRLNSAATSLQQTAKSNVIYLQNKVIHT